MAAIKIPDPLPPWITPDREVIEFFLDQDLEELSDDSLAARTGQWILHGGGPAQSATWTGAGAGRLNFLSQGCSSAGTRISASGHLAYSPRADGEQASAFHGKIAAEPFRGRL
jgi:hypothetical protein